MVKNIISASGEMMTAGNYIAHNLNNLQLLELRTFKLVDLRNHN